MSKAEEKALEVYPKMSRISEPHGVIPADYKSHYLGDANEEKRMGFIEGYHQAKEDLRKSIYKAGVLDGFEDAVEGQYEKGYEQAEKDLELTWEDISMLRQIMFDYNRQVRDEMSILNNNEDYCKEVLKRFKEQRTLQYDI